MQNIAKNISQVRKSMALAAMKCDRDVKTISLLAVSKTQNSTAITRAIAAGVRDFGENYVNELIEKAQILADEEICWHFIGPLQSNKAKPVAQLCHWVHSIDRLKIAQRLTKYRPKHMPALNVLLQVNIDQSPTKSGCKPEETLSLAQALNELPALRLRGLMCIPDPSNTRANFEALARLKNTAQKQLDQPLDTLSMGMSKDLDQAIAAGSTCVRIGTGIFGPRAARTTNSD